MARMLVKLSALALVAGALAACETIDGAATATSETVGSWYQSAKDTVSDSAQPTESAPNYFARELDGDLAVADAHAISREGAKTLNQGTAGTAVEWRNPETGVQAVFIPGDSVLEKRKVAASMNIGVDRPLDLEIIGEIYKSRHNANLRSAPGIENPVVGRLVSGELFTAIGRSRSQAWILVARDGQVVGYVYEPLVAATASAGRTPELREAVVSQPDSDGKPTFSTILAATPCRNLAYDVVTGSGQRARAELRACKAGDGSWEIN
ncbi:MAG: SH3 domain-containing protein [Alphaproteobacteria bacterium]